MKIKNGNEYVSKGNRSSSSGPVAEFDRINRLDVIRGFAVFGILVANIFIYAYSSNNIPFADSTLDRFTGTFLSLFVEGKFYALFCILFGMGLALQTRRAEYSGVQFTPVYIRRLILLFLFGLVHGIFIFSADILSFYALIAFLAFPFRKLKAGSLLKVIVVVFSSGFIILGSYSRQHPGEIIPKGPNWQNIIDEKKLEASGANSGNSSLAGEKDTEDSLTFTLLFLVPGLTGVTEKELYEFMADEERIFKSGTLKEMILHRFVTYILVNMPLKIVFLGWWVLTLFLTGMYLIHKLFFVESKNLKHNYKKLAFSCLSGGFILQMAGGVSQMFAGSSILIIPVFVIGIFSGSLLMSLGYASVITLIHIKKSHSFLLSSFTSIGRLSLTNYIGQSVICGFIFNSYGFGFLGEIRVIYTLLLTIPVFLFQVIFSNIWLRFFSIGPAEWLWRSLTYWKVQSMIRKT